MAYCIYILVWVDDFAVGASSAESFRRFVAGYKDVEGLDIPDEGSLRRSRGLRSTEATTASQFLAKRVAYSVLTACNKPILP